MVTYSPQAQTQVSGRSTRDHVFNSVLTHGPISAATIGKQLNLTPAAVRRHLDALEDEGLVSVQAVRTHQGAGRPSRRYVVTQQGQSEVGSDYVEVASSALSMVTRLGGENALRGFARHYFAEIEQKFNAQLKNTEANLNERIALLTKVLDELGYAASTRKAGRGAKVTTLRAAQICQGHCPIQELAAEYPQFCEEETDLFARLLKVDVRRLATMPTGGHVCTTHVPLGRQAHASLAAHQVTK